MARRTSDDTSTSVVLADVPERARVRELQAMLELLRDEIGSLDLEIQSLRDELSDFECSYNFRLAGEFDGLRRIDHYLRNVQRWTELLQSEPDESMIKRAKRIERRRQTELEEQVRERKAHAHRQAGAGGGSLADHDAGEEIDGDGQESRLDADYLDDTEALKVSYRAMARRFHPDLARSEKERVQFGKIMAQVNELYRNRDLERLRALEEQAKGGEIEDATLSAAAQIELLAARLEWFENVVRSLREEMTCLEGGPTCRLMRDVQRAAAQERDLVAELGEEMRARIGRSNGEVRQALLQLEDEVKRHNSKMVTRALARRAQRDDLANTFDPLADKRLIRLGLEELATAQVSAAAREHAEWIAQLAQIDRPQLHLILLTAVSELSPLSLAGLDSLDGVALRLEALVPGSADSGSLDRRLVEADHLLAYGVTRATEKLVRTGLRFVSDTTREALPLALKTHAVRREFRRVLGVLGDHMRCPHCGEQVFVVPLYRMRGLDDLRATVCPACTETVQCYWMPQGKDVQSVLNETYVDYELVSEWSFRLGRAGAATQLLPQQVERMTVGDLKGLIIRELFARYDVGVEPGQVRFFQDRQRLDERTPLEALTCQSFVVRLTKDAEMTIYDAAEILKHRIRDKFNPEHTAG